jgi:ornithine cyclodeaminase
MTETPTRLPPALTLVPGPLVGEILNEHLDEARELVRNVYVLAAEDRLVNPESMFLRPDALRPDRVIALSAYVREPQPAMGIKWIASFPGNLDRGLPRASAIIVLNDTETGFPCACLEGGQISAVRTALSAAVGAEALARDDRAGTMAIVGAGRIAETTLHALLRDGWQFQLIKVHDLDGARAEDFVRGMSGMAGAPEMVTSMSPQEALTGASLALLATTATRPYLLDPAAVESGATVLHMSLRDLGPAVIAGADNVVDDVAHALRERTSLALAVAESRLGRQDIRPVGDILRGHWAREPGRTAIYSPFGLGSLDVALARLVLTHAEGRPELVTIPGFFSACDIASRPAMP